MNRIHELSTVFEYSMRVDLLLEFLFVHVLF